MKSVALLLYGQPRYLNNPRSSIGFHDHIISKYNTDIYGHTWIADQYIASSWTQLEPILGTNIESKLKIQYPGISLNLEPVISFNDDLNLNNLYSHFYSIEQVSKMITNPEKYSWIVLSRFDCDLHYLNSLEDVEPGFYSMLDWKPGIYHACEMADQLLIFSPKYLSFCNLYSNIEILITEEYNGIEHLKIRHFRNLFGNEIIQRHSIDLDLIRSETEIPYKSETIPQDQPPIKQPIQQTPEIILNKLSNNNYSIGNNKIERK